MESTTSSDNLQSTNDTVKNLDDFGTPKIVHKKTRKNPFLDSSTDSDNEQVMFETKTLWKNQTKFEVDY